MPHLNNSAAPSGFCSGEQFRGSGSWGFRRLQPPPGLRFSKFFKKSRKKIAKCIISAYFSQFNKILKPTLIFRAFIPKIQIVENFGKIMNNFDKNSIEKIFWRLLGKLMLKLEPSKITSFFSNMFFSKFWGGGFPTTLAAHM